MSNTYLWTAGILRKLSDCPACARNTLSVPLHHGDEEPVGAVAGRREQQPASPAVAADTGRLLPTLAFHESRQGNAAKSEWFARNQASWSPFSSGSTEQVT